MISSSYHFTADRLLLEAGLGRNSYRERFCDCDGAPKKELQTNKREWLAEHVERGKNSQNANVNKNRSKAILMPLLLAPLGHTGETQRYTKPLITPNTSSPKAIGSGFETTSGRGSILVQTAMTLAL